MTLWSYFRAGGTVFTAVVEWITIPEPRPGQKQRRLRRAPLLIFGSVGFIALLRSQFLLFCRVYLKQIFPITVLVNRKVMVLVPLAPRWENSMESNQIAAGGLGCWLDLKGFALTCHNANHGQGAGHTHSIVVGGTAPRLFPPAPHSFSLSPSFSVSDNCIIWPYRGI